MVAQAGVSGQPSDQAPADTAGTDLYRCTASIATYGRGCRVRSVGCGCVFHAGEIDGGCAPCGHRLATWQPLPLTPSTGTLAREADVRRWLEIVAARLRGLRDERLEQLLEQPVSGSYAPETRAGAGYAALITAVGPDVAETLLREVIRAERARRRDVREAA